MSKLQIKIFNNKLLVGRAAAEYGAKSFGAAIRDNGPARIVATTGAKDYSLSRTLVQSHWLDLPFLAICLTNKIRLLK